LLIFPDFSNELTVIIELIYCQIADNNEHIQHPAMIFGRTLGEVVEMYTNKVQHIHVSIIPPIDMAFVALAPKCWSVASGVPV
jgi:hypothetical protein